MKFIKAYHFCIFIFVTVLIFLGLYYTKSVRIPRNEMLKLFIETKTEKFQISEPDKENEFNINSVNSKSIIQKPSVIDIKPSKKVAVPIEEKIENSSPKKITVPTNRKTQVSNQKKPEFNYGFNSVEEAEQFYYQMITKNTISCSKHERVGRYDDGGWDVCLDDNFVLKPSNCLSYSFGVNYIWEFDDAIATDYKCIVRTFDPSMDREANEFQRPSKVWFYKIGLGKDDTTWSNGWKIMKMSSILKKFHEENKVIDILKIDIEFSEWDSFESMVKDGLLSKVKQLMFETHTEEVQGRTTTKENFIRFLKVWNSLYEAGFRQWKNSWNRFGNYLSKHTGMQRTCCFEHYLININYM